MDYQELIERLRKKVISPFDLGPVADAIESLLAENERLKAELAKYRDAPVAAWKIAFKAANTPDGFLTIHYHGTNAITDYRQIDPNATVEQLIVKPGE